jgi:hypothetical protein
MHQILITNHTAAQIEVYTPQAIVMRSLRSIYYRRGVETKSWISRPK